MTVVTEGLMPAFEHLRKVRASATNPVPELNRRQLYEDFARVLWHGYKDLFPKAALILGFNIGFLFKGDGDFEKGLAEFMTKGPSLILDVPELLRRQRANWQQELAGFRNDFLEHRKRDIAEFALYYQPKTAEMRFEHACKQWPSYSLPSSRPALCLPGRSRKSRKMSATRDTYDFGASFSASR